MFQLAPLAARSLAARSPLPVLVALALAAPAPAQTDVLSHPNQFTPGATIIGFEGVSAPLTVQYESLGVTFQLSDGQGAGLVDDASPRVFGPSGDTALNNVGDGVCPCADLEMTFVTPIHRVGFEIRNRDDEDTYVTLSCVEDGQQVGTTQFFVTGQSYTFVGLESAQPFDHVLVDVSGAGLGAFRLDNLRFEAYPTCPEGKVFRDGFESASLAPTWSVLGPSGVVTSSLGTAPAEGRFQAMLATDELAGAVGAPASPAELEAFLGLPEGELSTRPVTPYDGAAMFTEIEVLPGDVLTLSWNFLTNEATPDPVNNDFGFVTLVSGDALLLVDTFYPVFRPTVTGFSEETGIRARPPYTFTTAGTVRLGIGLVNAYDGTKDSALLIDCVVVEGDHPTNQPPDCSADLTLARSKFIEAATPGFFIVTEGEELEIPFEAIDPDGDELTLTAEGLPSGATFEPPSGSQSSSALLRWTPTSADKRPDPYAITITFTDPAGASSACTVGVEEVNLRPVCDAGGDENGEYHAVATSPAGAVVQLQGSAEDPDDSSLLFHWDVSDLGVVLDDPDSPTPSGTFPIGVTTVTLTVTDARGGMSLCDAYVCVRGATPPEVQVTTDIAALWPVDHRLVPVQVEVIARVECPDPDAILPIVATVRSDEPDDADGLGDGQTTGDVGGLDGYTSAVDITSSLTEDPFQPGRFTGTIYLRAERAGRGDGRSYVIDVRAFDSLGAEAITSCAVIVPHDRRRGSN